RSVYTNSLGQFSSGALATNSYVAITRAPLYINKIYNNILCQPYCAVADGTPIAITSGVNISTINFALEKGGSISGTVTDAATNLPIPNAPVYINEYSFNATSGMTYSDGSGNFIAGGLFSGTFYAYVDNFSGAEAYFGEIYDNILCLPPSMCGNERGDPIV